MRRARRSPQEIQIEHGLDWWAVALIGYVERVPRHFDDNDGMQPCRFALTREPWKAHQQEVVSQFEICSGFFLYGSAAITSAGRFWPLGPFGMVASL